MADDRELDELLDRALASYATEEPDPSLRARIMARIAEAAPRTSRIWLLGSVSASAAALLLAFLLHSANRSVEVAAEAPAVATVPAPPATSTKLNHTLTLAARPHVVAAIRHSYDRRKPTLPHRSISLASAPLTEEETILLRFAQQHPEQAREVLSPPPSGPIRTDPVIIAPIQIADLSGSRSDSH